MVLSARWTIAARRAVVIAAVTGAALVFGAGPGAAADEPADIVVSSSADVATAVNSKPIIITTTLRNEGAGAAVDLEFLDSIALSDGDDSQPSTLDIDVTSCVSDTGIPCTADDVEHDGNLWNVTATVGELPAGGSVTLVYRVVPQDLPKLGCDSTPLALWAFAGSDQAGEQVRVDLPVPQDPCLTADLSAGQTSDRSSVDQGGSFTVASVFANEGPLAETQVSVYSSIVFDESAAALFSGADVEIVSCTVSAAPGRPVGCGSLVLGQSGPAPGWSGVVGPVPVGGEVSVVARITPTTRRTGVRCGSGPGTVHVDTVVRDLGGFTDPDESNNEAVTKLVTPAPEPCRADDVEVTQATDSPLLAPGHPITFRTTVTNHGDVEQTDVPLDQSVEPARGAVAGSPVAAGVRFHFQSCSSTDPVSCQGFSPIDYPPSARGGHQPGVVFAQGVIPVLPAHASVTVVSLLTVAQVTRTSCATPAARWGTFTGVSYYPGETDPDPGNNSVDRFFVVDVGCADLQVGLALSAVAVPRGSTVHLTATVSNPSPSVAGAVQFTETVPAGLLYRSSSCRPSSSTSVCGSLTYDPSTRVLSGTMTRIGAAGGSLEIVVSGVAGTPGVSSADARVSLTGVQIVDPDLSSNTARLRFSVSAAAVTSTAVTTTSGTTTSGTTTPGTTTSGTTASGITATTTTPTTLSAAAISSGPQLAATGVDVGRLATWAAFLVVVGAALTIRRPRRRYFTRSAVPRGTCSGMDNGAPSSVCTSHVDRPRRNRPEHS